MSSERATQAVMDWLLSLGQALSGMSLYDAGHPSRQASRTRSFDRLRAALGAMHPLRITFLDDDLVVGTHVVHDMRAWELGRRLSGAGIQRIEFVTQTISEQTFGELLEVLHGALGPAARHFDRAVTIDGVRLGPVALVGAGEREEANAGSSADSNAEGTSPTVVTAVGMTAGESSGGAADGIANDPASDMEATPLLDALIADGLNEELDTLTWITSETASTDKVPMAEVEAVIRGLSLAMQAEQGTLLPLVSLKSVDQYTTVHACNVAMMSMGLAESLGFGSRDVRAVGTAALLHDIGKVRLPQSLLTKTGGLTEMERAVMRTHTIEGAKLLGERGEGHALAAIVAYEHHIWADGTGGYPSFAFPRKPHYVSRLVQVCDVYDALCTRRPYREAWPRARTLHHMRLQAGRELDYDLLLAFFDLLDRAEKRQAIPAR